MNQAPGKRGCGLHARDDLESVVGFIVRDDLEAILRDGMPPLLLLEAGNLIRGAIGVIDVDPPLLALRDASIANLVTNRPRISEPPLQVFAEIVEVHIVGGVHVAAVLVVIRRGEAEQKGHVPLLDRVSILLAEGDDLAVVLGVVDVGIRDIARRASGEDEGEDEEERPEEELHRDIKQGLRSAEDARRDRPGKLAAAFRSADAGRVENEGRVVESAPFQEKTMSDKLVSYEVEGGIATLRLNDPPMNAYTHEMMKALDEAILRARFDRNVHVLVITGHGERFFCAGANINMLKEADPTFKYYFCLHANETLNRLEHTPKLVIAALNGHAVGGGLEIAMACDLRIARKGAGKIGLPELNLGVLPGTGGTQRLARLVGKAQAMKLMLEASNMNLEDGVELGLVHEAWEAESASAFHEKVIEYAKGFVPPNRAAFAVGRIKRAVQSGLEMSFEQALALERELQAELFASEDSREGLKAFIEKRKPEFRGK